MSDAATRAAAPGDPSAGASAARLAVVLPVRVGRSVLLPTLLVAASAVALGAGLAGRDAALSALAGGAVAPAFFALTLVSARVARDAPPAALLGLVLLTYGTKVAALVVLLGGLQGVPWVDRPWLGFTALTCALIWLVGFVVATSRHRVPVDAEARA